LSIGGSLAQVRLGSKGDLSRPFVARPSQRRVEGSSTRCNTAIRNLLWPGFRTARGGERCRPYPCSGRRKLDARADEGFVGFQWGYRLLAFFSGCLRRSRHSETARAPIRPEISASP